MTFEKARKKIKEYAVECDNADRKRYEKAKSRADDITNREMAYISGRISARAEIIKAVDWYLNDSGGTISMKKTPKEVENALREYAAIRHGYMAELMLDAADAIRDLLGETKTDEMSEMRD